MNHDDTSRYDRQIRLFGVAGQRAVAQAHLGIVGLGGLGSHIAQQLVYLGIRRYTFVDGDRIDDHSLNRVVTARPDDIGAYKTDLAERLIRTLLPDATVTNIRYHLGDGDDAERELAQTDLIIGGLDHDSPRLDLADVASRHQIVYIDAATDTHAGDGVLTYGGRIVTAGIQPGCLYCLGHLDQRAIRLARMTTAARADEAALYGIPLDELETTGPSVVTLNGVIASLAATEAMVHLTGLRQPQHQLTYRADHGGVRVNTDTPTISACPLLHPLGPVPQPVDPTPSRP
jgi:molybdopterin-synthase adenylyltransferase